MKNPNPLHDLHETITREITEERDHEMAELIAEKRLQAKSTREQYQTGIEAINAMGLNMSNLDALNLELTANSDKELLEIEARMDEQSQQSAPVSGPDIEGSFLPDGASLLTPHWVGSFSDDDVQDELIEASSTASQTLLGGGGCKNHYNWAKGAGSGLFGTGVGKIQLWIDFGFWFKPNATRFYSVRPLFRLRGYVIVKSDDGVFTSKRADVKATAWTNVHQYNWKGWNSVTMYDEGNDNINMNRRMDIDRHTQSSYLLAKDDWAYIRCTIGLYAYARGSGSYAKNDFSTGAANYLCVPHCHVF